MDRLTTERATIILNKAGAQSVKLRTRGFGRFMEMLAFFVHRGIGHVWRIRGDGYVQNFERDVKRELA